MLWVVMNILNKLKYVIVVIALIGGPLAMYWETPGFGFVWDDKPLYINEKNFPYENTFQNLPRDFVPQQTEMYIPLTKSAWAVTAAFSQVKDSDGSFYYSPEIFHIVNLVFHIINGFLVFFIIRKLLENDWAALFGALLFAVHPVNIESVAWVSELRGLMSAFCGFIAIIIFMKHREEPGKLKYSFTFLFLIFSVLSKPSGIVFPVILILMDIIENKPKLKTMLLTLLPLLLVALPVVYTTIMSESSATEMFEYPDWMRPLFLLDSFWFYIVKAVAPYDLAATYGRTPQFVSQGELFYYTGAALLVIVGLLVWKRKSSKHCLTALVVFLVGFLPVSGLIPFYYQYWSLTADRYIYVSMMGFALCLSTIAAALERPKLVVPIAILILGGYFYLGMEQVAIWQNDLTLWTNAIERYPDRSPQPYTGRGQYFLGSGDPKSALADFNKVVQIDSTFPEAFLNRGNAYFDLNRFDMAAADYSRSIAHDSANPSKAYINRARAYGALGRLEDALKDYTTALKYNPEDVFSVYSDRGIVYGQMGLLDEAIGDFTSALKINPRSKIAYENLQYAQLLKEKLQNKKIDSTGVVN